MADPKLENQTAAAEVEEKNLLDSIFEKVSLAPPAETVDVNSFKDTEAAVASPNGMMAAALSVFVDAVNKLEQPVDRIDKHLLDSMISELDQTLSTQLDEIMHHPQFQKVESSWRGLKFLVDRTDFRKNNRIEILDVSKDTLRESFEDAPEMIQSALYGHIYGSAYDQAGADPYSVMIGNYEFDSSAQDVSLLTDISKVAAASHCPFISSVGARFFKKDSIEDWKKIPDLSAYMETTDFVKWNAFRETEDARYVGLTFPRFLLRVPYGADTVPSKGFNYTENVKAEDSEKYLWGNTAFSFAANMTRAFAQDGWCVQIRGPQSGGKVDGMPVHLYDAGRGKEMKIPTEIAIDETREFETANLGFIPLVHYQGKDFASFFSANSVQKPVIFDDAAATANSRVNSRLPYILLASRLAHYLKVIQRENIGSTKDKTRIEAELNRWLKGLVTETPNPSESIIARYPLRAGQVTVDEIEENPGFYKVAMMFQPHFQVEGMDISLQMVGKMPKGK
jgi:type VI secretion system protein ImpC